MRARPSTAVVHLVRASNAPSAFQAFLASYERTPAGREHELVLLFKGFGGERATRSLMTRAASHRPRALHVPDTGLDLTAYLYAAAVLPHDRLFFANSFTELSVAGWLDLLSIPLDDGPAGAAGATASWGSNLGYDLFQLGVGGGYGAVFEDRRAVRRHMQHLAGAPHRGELVHRTGNLLNVLRDVPTRAAFPSMHLRTNAFLIERGLLTAVSPGRLRSKRACYRFESGRDSLTMRLRARGRPAVSVDSTGAARGACEWHLADVFWQAAQQDLLVADNQTRHYDAQPFERREVLSRFAWGPLARPAEAQWARSATES